MTYYDMVLSGMFLCLVAGLVLGMQTSLSFTAAFGPTALIASGLMYHAMFRNAPVSIQESM